MSNDMPTRESRATTERPDRTELGYRRFRCHACHRGFNERTDTPYNRLQYPTDVVSWWSCGGVGTR